MHRALHSKFRRRSGPGGGASGLRGPCATLAGEAGLRAAPDHVGCEHVCLRVILSWGMPVGPQARAPWAGGASLPRPGCLCSHAVTMAPQQGVPGGWKLIMGY